MSEILKAAHSSAKNADFTNAVMGSDALAALCVGVVASGEEQRTANLIAFLDLEQRHFDGMTPGLLEQVRERLGIEATS